MSKETNISFIAAVVLCALIWFGGEYFGWPDRKIRMAIICVVLILWIFLYIVQKVMAVRSARLIEQRLQAQAQEQMANIRPDQKGAFQEVQQKLNEAIASLRQSRLGSSALYTLPWYIIIGPPGSGKSTALLQSGLNFPFTNQREIRGVGGTRNCDWFFTDRGILLDTAGRYTTELEDRDEWHAFLNMLKRARKTKPINGVLVAVSVTDVVQGNDEQLEALAKTIRQRMDELVQQLELVFPVYLLFTKCDLLSGFVEFFEDLNKESRGQVWGCSLPYSGTPNQNFQQIFETEAKKLYTSLCAQRVSVLHHDRSADKKRGIYMFPLQFALAHKRLAEFVGLVFKPNPFQESALFRGFYFTSGTQEGTPIDKVLEAMGSAWGLAGGAAGLTSQTVDKKSYFITRLFTDIIFGDQNLARSATRVARRQRLARLATAVLSVLGLALLTVALFISFFGNRMLMNDVAAAVSLVREHQEKGASLGKQLEAIEDLRQQVERLDRFEHESLPWSYRWGLYRGSRLRQSARKAYFERLKTLHLNPLLANLEGEFRRRLDQPNKNAKDYYELYELHRVYQMLCGATPDVNVELIEQELRDERHNRWLKSLTSDLSVLTDPQRNVADEQLTYFLSQFKQPDLERPKIDKQLDMELKQDISRNERTQVKYKELVEAAERDLPKFSRDSLKVDNAKLITIEHTFSTLYSQDEWDKFRIQIKSAATDLAKEYASVGLKKTAEEVEALMKDFFEADYKKNWTKFISTVKVEPFENLQVASERLKQHCKGDSPVAFLFRMVWTNQRIKLGPNDVRNAPLGGDSTEWISPMFDPLRKLQIEIEKVTKQTKEGERIVTLLKKKMGDTPMLDLFTNVFNDCSAELGSAVDKCPDEGFRAHVREILVKGIFAHAYKALRNESEQETDRHWQREVLSRWNGMKDLYPFNLQSEGEVPLGDFTALFGPKGKFWSTLEDFQKLQTYRVEGNELAVLGTSFQIGVDRAKTFKSALYPSGEGTMEVPFTIQLYKAPAVEDVRFYLGEESFSIDDVPGGRNSMTWRETKTAGAKLAIKVFGLASWVEKPHDYSNKPWGLLRFLQGGKAKDIGDGKTYSGMWTLFAEPGGAVQKYDLKLRIETKTKENPFQEGFFQNFPMPEKVGQ